MAERDLVVRLIGDDKSLTKAFRGSSREAKRFEATFTRSSRGISRALGAAGVVGGLAGVTLALRSTINAAIDFESTFAGVRKTVDATEPQLQALADGFRAMSREIPVSVAEINRIGEAAGQLGVQQNAILDFTRTVADLGATTNLTSEQAADAFARLANITGLPQAQFDQLGSTVVELGNRLAATESEILDFSLRIAGAGKQVGLTEAQILAISGAFSSVGVEAERGGSAVSKVLLSINSAVLGGGKTLELFAETAGTSVAGFRDAFKRDAGQALVAFVEGLDRVRREGGNTFKVLKDLGLADIRLISAFQGIAGAGDLLNRSLRIGNRAFEENTALIEESEKRYGTAASRLKVFRNRVNDLQITLGEALVPVLEDIITPLSDWLEKTENQERLQRELSSALREARGVFQGVADVVVPLARATGELVEALGGARNAVKLLLVAMVVSKITTYALALGAVGTAAGTSAGQVNLLRLALLRLPAVIAVTVAVELAFGDRVRDKFAAGIRKLGRALGEKDLIELEPKLRLERLREDLEHVDRLLGSSSDRAKELRRQIAATRREIFGVGIGPRPEEGVADREILRRRQAALDARRRRGGKTPTELDADAEAKAQEAAARRARRAAAAAKRAREKAREQLLRERAQERARAIRQREALQRDQFRALGLDVGGGERIARVGALRQRLSTLRDQVKGTFLDTDEARGQLQRIAKVLSGAFGKVGKDVRSAIQGMLKEISDALEGGADGGPLTKFRKVGTRKLTEGLDISPEDRRRLRSRLSQVGRGGTVPQRSIFGQQAVGAPAGGIVIAGDINVRVDGGNPDAVMRAIQNKVKKRSATRTGRRRGRRSGLGG